MRGMPDDVTNLFVHRAAAQRYAAARPFFHPLVMRNISGFLGTSRFAAALDIGCGTGQSSRALAEIADAIDAIDISREMIDEAQPHPRIRFHVASAEQLPFADASFDLATVGLAFHWLDHAKFLAEAHRVLKPGCSLIIYNSGSCGEMTENPAFREWAWEVYPKRFPTPPRRTMVLSAELVAPHSFELSGTEKFTHDERMSAQQLTEYLLTQTNVIAAVENGSTPLDEATRWIHAGVTPFFRGANRTMKFAGTSWYLRRT
jgi:SAM-dependent methyltransferase